MQIHHALGLNFFVFCNLLSQVKTFYLLYATPLKLDNLEICSRKQKINK